MNKEPNFKMLGVNVKKCREEKGYTVKRLAKEAGVSESHIKNIESANTHPSIKTLLYFVEILKVSPNDLLVDSLDREMRIDVMAKSCIEKMVTYGLNNEEIELVFQYTIMGLDVIKKGGKGSGRE